MDQVSSNLRKTEHEQHEETQSIKKDQTIVKRPSRKYPKQRRDVYVNSKSSFKAQLEKCKKLLDSGETDICIHGMGGAVNCAVHLALVLQSKYLNTIKLSVNTSTVKLFDDFLPEEDDIEPETSIRNNSAVHILVHQIDLLK
ncbi:ribonuclease P protein subunit p20 isoform X2 [Tachypleus tridentatus]